MAVARTDDVADWFRRNLKAAGKDPSVVTEEHARCLRTLTAITEPSGLYNLPTVGSVVDGVSFWPTGGVSVVVHGELATFDFDRLTRLVIAAHRDHVRVAVGPWLAHQDEDRARTIAQWMTGEYGYEVEWDDPAVWVRCHGDHVPST